MMKAAGYIDQVLRKQRICRDHPELRIDHLTAPSWHWRARWAADGTRHELTDHDLGALLDAVEPLLDPYGRLTP